MYSSFQISYRKSPIRSADDASLKENMDLLSIGKVEKSITSAKPASEKCSKPNSNLSQSSCGKKVVEEKLG